MIERARRILKDTTDTNYRYTQESMVDSVNDALLEVRRVRPDLFLSSSFEVADVALADIETTNIPIEDFYFQTLVYMTTGYQMLRDDEFSLDSRAVNMLNKGVSQLITVAS